MFWRGENCLADESSVGKIRFGMRVRARGQLEWQCVIVFFLGSLWTYGLNRRGNIDDRTDVT